MAAAVVIAMRARVRLAQPWLPLEPMRPHRGPIKPSPACARCLYDHLCRPRPYFVVLARIGFELWVCEWCLRPEDAPHRAPVAPETTIA